MHDDYKLPNDPDADFHTEINEYLLKAGADLNDPGELHEPALRSAIKSFDLAGRKIPQWAETFRDAK